MEFSINVPYTLYDFIVRSIERALSEYKIKKDKDNDYLITFEKHSYSLTITTDTDSTFVLVEVVDCCGEVSYLKFVPLSDEWKITGNEKSGILLYSDYSLSSPNEEKICNEIVHEVSSESRLSNKQLFKLEMVYHTTDEPTTVHSIVQ